jgi:hypothetical protein
MDLCYTVVMDKNHHIWQVWAQKLHHWGVSEIAASGLEASGVASILGAEMIYFLQPLLGGLFPDTTLSCLAKLLENPSQKQEFIAMLREEAPH